MSGFNQRDNRARDDAIDDGLEGVSRAMCYDVFVEYKGERTPEQVNFIVSKVKEMEGTRAATISDVTNIVKGNEYLDRFSVPVHVNMFGAHIGVSLELYFDHDVVTSPWQGQDSFTGLVADDLTEGDGSGEVLTYKWSKDHLLGKWGTRQLVVSGWEATAEYEGVRLSSWEDKERVLTKILADVLMSDAVINGACHDVAHVTVPGVRVRSQPIGDGHRGFLLYTMSDVAVKSLKWLRSPSGVAALTDFHIALHTVDAYKTILNTADSSVGSQVTDSMEAEREGRMMIIWSAPASMTVEALQSFFDDPAIGQASGTVVMIEPKRAYSNGRRYVLITQKKIIDAVPDQQANMMNELVMVETQAQSFFQSQTIKFQKSRSRIERAQDKARYSTRRENNTFAQVAVQPSFS